MRLDQDQIPPLPEGILLRDFTPADIPDALALWRKTEGVGLNESDSPEALTAFLERNRGLSLVVAHDGTLRGTLLCGHDGRRGYLHHLAVESTCRKQGLGRALVEGSLMRLRRLGIQKCNLFLFETNLEGRKFWNHLGWGIRDDLILVQKSL